jgi:hypothetical protein
MRAWNVAPDNQEGSIHARSRQVVTYAGHGNRGYIKLGGTYLGRLQNQ